MLYYFSLAAFGTQPARLPFRGQVHPTARSFVSPIRLVKGFKSALHPEVMSPEIRFPFWECTLPRPKRLGTGRLVALGLNHQNSATSARSQVHSQPRNSNPRPQPRGQVHPTARSFVPSVRLVNGFEFTLQSKVLSPLVRWPILGKHPFAIPRHAAFWYWMSPCARIPQNHRDPAPSARSQVHPQPHNSNPKTSAARPGSPHSKKLRLLPSDWSKDLSPRSIRK